MFQIKNILYRNKKGETPLLCASDTHTNIELVKLLLDAGAEVNPTAVSCDKVSFV